MVNEYDAVSYNIGTVLYENKYKVPDYQREYNWKEDKIETLWKDLIYAAQPGRKKRKYLLGPLVQLQDRAKLEIVDGQQRLVTLSLLFRALKYALKSLDDNNSIKNIELIKTELDEAKGHVQLAHSDDNKTFKNIRNFLSEEKFQTQHGRRRLGAKKMTETQQNLIINYNHFFRLAQVFYNECGLGESGESGSGSAKVLEIIKNMKRNVMFILITIKQR